MPDESAPQSRAEGPVHTRITPLDIVRFVVELFTFFTFAWWGFTAWPLPWNIVAGVAAPAVAILIWALFLSPKPVFRVHPFVAAFAELVVFAAATIAWWSLGQVWIGLAFAVVAVTSGVLVGRRRLS